MNIAKSAALDSLAAGLADELARQGYRAAGIARHVRLLHRLAKWMAGEGLDFGEMTTYQVDRFVQSRRTAAQAGWPSRRGMRPLLAYLRSAGLFSPAPTELVTAAPVDRVTAAYGRFLTRERSLAASTMENYLRYVGVFFAGFDAPVRADVTLLSAADVTAAIRRQCRSRSVGWVKNFATALRSLLRFLFVDGFVPLDLSGSVLSVAGWRHSGLPKALPRENLALLLASCSGQRHAARRDLGDLDAHGPVRVTGRGGGRARSGRHRLALR